jgi:hypothetical protein
MGRLHWSFHDASGHLILHDSQIGAMSMIDCLSRILLHATALKEERFLARHGRYAAEKEVLLFK